MSFVSHICTYIWNVRSNQREIAEGGIVSRNKDREQIPFYNFQTAYFMGTILVFQTGWQIDVVNWYRFYYHPAYSKNNRLLPKMHDDHTDGK